jgi:predicted kinase
VYIKPQQRKRLFQRARRQKTSFSEELREAIDLTIEARVSQLADSVKQAHTILQNHAERLARLEGKFELLEHTLASPRRRLPEKSP